MGRPTRLDSHYVNRHATLPYGLTVGAVEEAVAETYRLFHGLNDNLVRDGFRPLEELLLGNSLSGIISEFLVKNIAKASTTLEANLKVGGHPDLLPKGRYASNLVLKGEEGIEVKSSIQKGGWQGHNPEDCWLHGFPVCDRETKDWRIDAHGVRRNFVCQTPQGRLVILWPPGNLSPNANRLDHTIRHRETPYQLFVQIARSRCW